MSETISTRVSERTRKEVEKFMREEKLDKSAAIRKILKTGLEEWRKNEALAQLENGEVTFNEAAETAGMDVWSFANFVRKNGRNWIKSVERIRADLKAAEE